jgi:helix-turn-helix protein
MKKCLLFCRKELAHFLSKRKEKEKRKAALKESEGQIMVATILYGL